MKGIRVNCYDDILKTSEGVLHVEDVFDKIRHIQFTEEVLKKWK